MNIERVTLGILKGISCFALASIIISALFGIGFYLFFSRVETRKESAHVYYYKIPRSSTFIRLLHVKSFERVIISFDTAPDTTNLFILSNSRAVLINSDYTKHWTIPFQCNDGETFLYWNHYSSWSISPSFHLLDEDITDEKGRLKEGISRLVFENDYSVLTLSIAKEGLIILPFFVKEITVPRKEIKRFILSLQNVGRKSI